ncbi:MAG: hypothetical protein JWL59_906 [Chthoniobacteraceae bacterium]|nr:hypothetical protein [Chthoniobacteraceae bacterium]
MNSMTDSNNTKKIHVAVSSQDEEEFRIVWTLGFVGKRRLANESNTRQAVQTELESLLTAAHKEHAKLVAVSSPAIGGDLIFAEECLRMGIPWRAILPFDSLEFLKDDFSTRDEARFRQCIEKAYAVEVAPVDISLVEANPAHGDPVINQGNRNAAYLDAGYRVVESSDVVLFVWDGVSGGVGGSGDAWNYAETLKKPVWCWNPQTGRDERHRWPGNTGQGRDHKRLFNARLMPELLATLEALPQGYRKGKDTAMQWAVRARFNQLDTLALREQEKTKGGLQRVLTLHLVATVAAGISFTFLGGQHHPEFWSLALFTAIVGWTKPVCAYLALRHEKALHHDRHQDHWVDARVAAELCRSILITWTIPNQPQNIFDVEDFPRFRRLIHSLLTTRALDQPTIAAQSTLEEACASYVNDRLIDQADFFEKKRAAALKQHRIWHAIFVAATLYVIAGGSLLAAAHTKGLHFPMPDWTEQILACLLIIAPFLATYALAIQTIHDTRRRLARYAVMALYLRRQMDAIVQSRSSVARLRLIAATERMLIEELHEWDSVTRHITV